MPIPSIRHERILWKVGLIRCLLVTFKNPDSWAVHVSNGDSPICVEWGVSAGDAATIGERFRKMFIEGTSYDAPL